ncbi:MAG: hypothetical protein R6U85_03360 [Salinivirgaceae bacterium]|jgi:hypothetical protein
MRYIIIFILSLIFVAQGCDKKNDDYSSIAGEWIIEDNGEQSGWRQYTLSIQRVPVDSLQYAISNFYRTGVNNELRIEVSGYDILIRPQLLGNYSIEGSGTIQPDYKTISLEYEVRGGSVGFENVYSTLKRD